MFVTTTSSSDYFEKKKNVFDLETLELERVVGTIVSKTTM